MNSRLRAIGRLKCALLCAVLSLLLLVAGARAHETRPAYLEIGETAPGRYHLLWRTPLNSGTRLPVTLQFATGVRQLTEPAVRELPDSLLERWLIEIPGGLAGTRIDFVGLQATITDVLVRVQTIDGRQSTTLVRPGQPWLEIAADPGRLSVVAAYLRHGVDHILLGYDHLLFVFAMLLIVRQTGKLLWTISAFTLAHSITLALATLGLNQLAGPPVEASIALSIVLLACEIVRRERGDVTLTARWPWLVAFAFGLLHGLGFASALAGIGLPRGDIPLALIAFNIGVEIGQLVFIAGVLGFLALARRLALAETLAPAASSVAPYAIGVPASFWLFERLAAF